jgi:hypothetical protein
MIFSITVKPFFNAAKANDAPALVATLNIEVEDLGLKESKSIVIPMGLADTQLDITMNTAVDLFKNYVKHRYKAAYEEFHKQQESQNGNH